MLSPRHCSHEIVLAGSRLLDLWHQRFYGCQGAIPDLAGEISIRRHHSWSCRTIDKPLPPQEGLRCRHLVSPTRALSQLQLNPSQGGGAQRKSLGNGQRICGQGREKMPARSTRLLACALHDTGAASDRMAGTGSIKRTVDAETAHRGAGASKGVTGECSSVRREAHP